MGEHTEAATEAYCPTKENAMGKPFSGAECRAGQDGGADEQPEMEREAEEILL